MNIKVAKSGTICVIDDDEIYQFALKNQIRATHLADKILTFPDGEVAIEFFKTTVGNVKELPDIILLDLNMPIMDGWEFLEEFIQLKPLLPKGIKIYIVSSSVNQEDRYRAKSFSEVSDYIVKPITEKQLMELLGGGE